MSFVNPWFLLAFLAVSIPVIIHLFQFRRFRKVMFSNIRFLEELSEEKRKQSKLKHLLILISRVLAIIFLVLAFSRPFIPYEEAEISYEANAVSIFVDNSFSMEALSARGKLIDEAKLIADEIVENFTATDDFNLLTNEFEGRHHRFVSREDFISLLQEVELSPMVKYLSQVQQRQAEILDDATSQNNSLFIISDFQKNISDFENFVSDTTISTFLLPIRAQRADNVYIDSLWFENPVKLANQPLTVNVRIHNDGRQKLENQPLRMYVEDALRSVASFDIEPGEILEKQLSYTVSGNGVRQGWIEIVDYPVVFDDKKYFSFRVTENIPILVINQMEENKYLNALFEDDDTFDYRNMSLLNIDYSAFQNSDLIILNSLNSISSGLRMEIKRFVGEGGSIAVFPGDNIDFDSYREFLTSLNVNHYTSLDTNTYEVSFINELHTLFHGVFEEVPEHVILPEADEHYVISRNFTGREDQLMQLQNTNDFFTSYSSGRGQVHLSAVPLSEKFSDFPLHPVFVPIMYNAALHSVPQTKPYEVIGENMPVQIRHRKDNQDPVYYLKAGEMEIIPEVRMRNNRVNLYFHDQIKQAGNYDLYTDEHLIDGISFNYDRRESKMEVYDAASLEDKIADHQLSRINTLNVGDTSFEKAFERFTKGRELWQLCLLLALVFFLCEVLLLRFWK